MSQIFRGGWVWNNNNKQQAHTHARTLDNADKCVAKRTAISILQVVP